MSYNSDDNDFYSHEEYLSVEDQIHSAHWACKGLQVTFCSFVVGLLVLFVINAVHSSNDKKIIVEETHQLSQ